MKKAEEAFLWDTNVIWRLINSARLPYHDHVDRFLEEAEDGKCKIFTSSIAIAEIDPRHISQDKGPPEKFFRDLASSVSIVDALPPIMKIAGELRHHTFKYDGPDPNLAGEVREMGIGDSIFFATAIWLEDAGESNLTFHSFDHGRKKGWEGKCVPVVNFRYWCKNLDSVPIVQRAKAIKTKNAVHPLCPLPINHS